MNIRQKQPFQFKLNPNKLISNSSHITAQDVYQHYHLPQHLQQHMLLAAAVGQTIIKSWRKCGKTKLNKDLIITTLLTHDMGNIIKFDLSHPLGKNLSRTEKNHNYWEKLQQAFIDRYGLRADQANIKILQELHLPNESIQILENHTFEQLPKIISSQNWEEKIVFYGDLRLTPNGLANVEERIQDLKNRYQDRDLDWKQNNLVEQRTKQCLQLEEQLNQKTKFNLRKLSNKKLKDLTTKLTAYSLPISNTP